MLVYATSTQFDGWLDGPLPVNATTLLRSASLLVRDATVASIYTVDTEGYPTDTTVRQAFTDATCAQAAMWSVAGIDPAGGGVASTAPVRSKKLGSGSVEYDTSVGGSVAAYNARQSAARELCTEAWMILKQAGL